MSDRYEEITQKYLQFLDLHISDVVSGKSQEFMELNKISSELAVSHKHLIDILKQTKGNHPCYFYDDKIIEKAKYLLINTELSIAEIARKFTYDPSNFSKFFKKWTGKTPGQFRRDEKS